MLDAMIFPSYFSHTLSRVSSASGHEEVKGIILTFPPETNFLNWDKKIKHKTMVLRTSDNTKDSNLQEKGNNQGSTAIYPAYFPERTGKPRWSPVICWGWGDRAGSLGRPWPLGLMYGAELPWPSVWNWSVHTYQRSVVVPSPTSFVYSKRVIPGSQFC